MTEKRKEEIDAILIKTEQEILSGVIKTTSLEDFKSRQKVKREVLKKQEDAVKAMESISTYLKEHNIYFETDNVDGISRVSMVFQHCDRCPGRYIEGCIYFYDDCMEVKVFYSELGSQICRDSDKKPELYRLINYLQAKMWPCVSDGMNGLLYKSQYLICPRFYVTEDGLSDITAAMLIPYSHFMLDMLEIEDFITAAIPDLLDSLSIPLFSLITGKMSIGAAIHVIENEVLYKKQEE